MHPEPVEVKPAVEQSAAPAQDSSEVRSVAGASLPARAPPLRSLSRAINDTFQTFPVPVNSYPRTPYIKKVNNKLVMDEDLLRGRAVAKKASKKTPPELSLPYVPGASNSPMKKAKKPHVHHTATKSFDPWESQRNITELTSGARTPTNLPYM
ncbi:uncharacterized protein LOC135078530 [Ostrinia nubilalis]|uniref:uncharacterized protein LOC135078530 n=1 Tax=Ostrinia nubilalis TaxID=29057 RepID=UPI0030823BD5